MSQSSITIKAPGKLMIAGEYAVLEQYQRLVVTAIDRYVYATIDSSEQNSLTLESFGLKDLSFSITDEGVEIQTEDTRVTFVQKAIELASIYIKEQDLDVAPFSLTITSELDDASGVKYGLGSSAAVTTAVVSAVLHKHLAEAPSEETVFKIAALAHTIVQGSGSGADVAASSYSGTLEFASFQVSWLLDEYEKANKLSRLVKRNWQYSKLERCELPEGLHLCVGWTGKAASTTEYVAKIQKMKHESHISFAEFMVQSATAVQGVLHGMKDSSVALFNEGIQLNRDVLKRLGTDAGIEIETAELTKLCDLAEELGGVAKPSGAGGGDCGIAFMPSAEAAEALKKAWSAAGITPLELSIPAVEVVTES